MTARHDSSQPRVRRGAHRTRRSFVGALMPSVLAVAAVASLITALAVWQGEQPDQPSADAATRTSSGAAGTPSARTDEAKALATPTASASSTPQTTPEVTPATEVEGTKAEATPASTPSSVDRTAYEVVVLNQSGRAGLAAAVGQDLRDQGWTVPAVGNFRGIVPSTTVYYPPGAETAALAVAGDLRSEPRIRPRFGNLSTTRLTVVVTTSYPG